MDDLFTFRRSKVKGQGSVVTVAGICNSVGGGVFFWRATAVAVVWSGRAFTQRSNDAAEVTGSFQETASRKSAENNVKHRNGGVGSAVPDHRGGGESSVVVTTLGQGHILVYVCGGEGVRCRWWDVEVLLIVSAWRCGSCSFVSWQTLHGAGVPGYPPFRLCSSLVHSLPHLLLFITFSLLLFSSTLLIFFYCPSNPFLPE